MSCSMAVVLAVVFPVPAAEPSMSRCFPSIFLGILYPLEKFVFVRITLGIYVAGGVLVVCVDGVASLTLRWCVSVLFRKVDHCAP